MNKFAHKFEKFCSILWVLWVHCLTQFWVKTFCSANLRRLLACWNYVGYQTYEHNDLLLPCFDPKLVIKLKQFIVFVFFSCTRKSDLMQHEPRRLSAVMSWLWKFVYMLLLWRIWRGSRRLNKLCRRVVHIF